MRFLLLNALMFCVFNAFGQHLDTALLNDLSVRSIGPAGMSGRVTTIDVIREEPEKIFIGTASGGVWTSKNGGVSWKPIFDDQPTLAIGALSIYQSNPDVIWVGTGEGNPRNSHNSGKGVFKSIDGGRTWTCMGLEETKIIHRIIIHPDNPEVVYVGALGSAWGDSKWRGVFKTKDGGQTWTKILYVNDSTGVADMVLDPSNPEKLMVAMWEHRRQPWTFKSGGKGSGLYMTYDGGENWKQLTSKEGLPKGHLGRIGLSFAPSNPEIVYALVEAKENGLFRSEDGGHSWQKVASKNIGNRPFYYADIFVDPLNENRIFNLWSYVSLSEDGGKSFKTIMDYSNSVHPDHHALYIHPDNPKFIINGNDGGLNISYDGGKTWEFSANIPVGQFYHINIDTSFPYRIYGGMQDNGSWIGPSAILRRGGIRNYDWQEIYFGDGFDVLPILSDDRHGYAMSQGGNVARYDLETGKTTGVKPVHPEGERLRFNWNAAIAADPFNPDALYFGSQFVHYSNDRGRSWKIISPDLTTNDSLKQLQHLSGGLTIDATQAENYTTILAITPSRFDKDLIMVGTDDGRLQITEDGGEQWVDLTRRLPDCPEGVWIPQVVEGATEGTWWVIANDYRRNNWSAYAYRTDDNGQSFVRVVDDEDVDGFVCSVIQDKEDPNLVFMGTDVGLYFSIDGAQTWNRWPKTLPHVQIRDLKIHPHTNDLVVGTFGRSIYVVDDISILRNSGDLPMMEDTLRIIGHRDGALLSTKSYLGIRFYAQGEFIGDNTSLSTAKVYYWGGIHDEAKEEEEKKENQEEKPKKKTKKKGNKIKVTVLNMEGDTIREFRRDMERGFQTLGWNLRSNGIEFPSHREREKDADPPSGLRVSPGEYKVVLSWKGQSDSTIVAVGADPRRDLDADDIAERQNRLRSFYDYVEGITASVKTLKSIRGNMDIVQKSWAVLPDSTQKTLNEGWKPLGTRLDSLEKLILAPKDQKGYQDNSRYISSDIWNAYGYLIGEDEGYGDNAQWAFDNLKRKADPVVAEIRRFVEEDWATFKSEIKDQQLSIFKEDLPLNKE